MLVDTDRLKARIAEMKLLEESAGTPIARFAIWVRTAEAGRAVEIVEDFWINECGDIASEMQRDNGLCTCVLRKFGIEELSRDEFLFASCRFWQAARGVYQYVLVQARHLTGIIKDCFNWSRHP